MSAQLSDSHRRFLQTLMVQGIMSDGRAKSLHRFCCQTHKAHYDPENLDHFIQAINARLQPMSLQIRKGMSEDDGLQHYALVNLVETTVTRLSSDYADNELELFRKIMDLITGSDSGTASSIDILNSSDTLTSKKLKKSEAEQLLSRLVQDQWLCEKRGDYSLSTRCVIEMEPYIRTMYQDQIKVCHICHGLALQCQTCERLGCGVRIHHPCVSRFFRAGTEPRCPACNEVWQHQQHQQRPDPDRRRQSRSSR